MSNLEITRGDTFSFRPQPVERNGFYIETEHSFIGEVGGGYLTLIKYEKIAKLFADAGNTYQRCGLLPSELLTQGNERPKWVSVKDRLPKPNYRIPVKENNGRYNVSTYRRGNPQSEKYWSETVAYWLDESAINPQRNENNKAVSGGM
jgi:hypothetical protein